MTLSNSVHDQKSSNIDEYMTNIFSNIFNVFVWRGMYNVLNVRINQDMLYRMI